MLLAEQEGVKGNRFSSCTSEAIKARIHGLLATKEVARGALGFRRYHADSAVQGWQAVVERTAEVSRLPIEKAKEQLKAALALQAEIIAERDNIKDALERDFIEAQTAHLWKEREAAGRRQQLTVHKRRVRNYEPAEAGPSLARVATGSARRFLKDSEELSSPLPDSYHAALDSLDAHLEGLATSDIEGKGKGKAKANRYTNRVALSYTGKGKAPQYLVDNPADDADTEDGESSDDDNDGRSSSSTSTVFEEDLVGDEDDESEGLMALARRAILVTKEIEVTFSSVDAKDEDDDDDELSDSWSDRVNPELKSIKRSNKISGPWPSASWSTSPSSPSSEEE